MRRGERFAGCAAALVRPWPKAPGIGVGPKICVYFWGGLCFNIGWGMNTAKMAAVAAAGQGESRVAR